MKTMSKEFSGGAAPAGFSAVPFNWCADDATPIAVTQFDHAALDSLEDRARERLAAGQSLEPLLEEAAVNVLKSGPPELVERLVRRIYSLAGEEMTSRFLALIIDAPHPRVRIMAIAHVIGSSVLGNETVPATARRLGRRKQALYQEMRHVQNLLGFNIVRSNQRDESARAKMRKTNFRHRG